MNALSSATYSNNTQNLNSCNSIDSSNIEEILQGASILSGGGGGSYSSAIENYREQPHGGVEVRDLSEYEEGSNLATVFGLGPVDNSTENPLGIAQKSVEIYESEYGEIDGVILGELGPDLIVEAVAIADRLDIPVVNADVAGMRAVPSVQNEIIEESNVSRTPLVASNGTESVRLESGTGEEIEEEIRGLTDGDIWYVTGYANSANEYLDSHASQGWLEECLYFDQAEVEELGSGILESVTSREINGHTVGRMNIQGEETLEVFFQNENILAYRNGEQVAQAPDTISVIDEDEIGVENGDIPNEGTELEVYRISYDFWNNQNCFNLETLEITTDDETVTFNDTTEFNIQGEQR